MAADHSAAIRAYSFKIREYSCPKFELICPNAGLTEKRRWYKQVKTSRLKTGTGLAALKETIE
jgi:hypothetical protein